MQSTKSNFATTAGLALLAAAAMLAAYFGIGLLFAMLAGAFLVCLVSRLWTGYSLRRLSIDLGSSHMCGFPGDALSCDMTIENDKLLPVVWVRAGLPLGEDPCVSFSKDGAAEFSWIMPHQRLEWTEELRALRRGVCSVGEVELASGDGFGLSEEAKTEKLERELTFTVFPKLLDIDASCILGRLSELETSRRGMYTDPTLIRSIREYSGQDSFRDINWRMLAREGRLYTNIKEKMDTRRVCFVLDLETYSDAVEHDTGFGPQTVYTLREEQLERSISAAATAIVELTRKGVICSLVLPSYTVNAGKGDAAEKRSARMISLTENASEEPLLSALAQIDYEGGPAVLPSERISSEIHRLGQLFCFERKHAEGNAGLDSAGGAPVWYIASEGEAAARVIPEKELVL